MRTAKLALIAIIGTVLSACATGPSTRTTTTAFDEFYDGESETTYATQLPAVDAKEALLRGDKALQQGDADLALFQYVRALKLDPTSADAFYRVGNVHLEKQRHDLAEKAFRFGLANDKEHAGIHEGLGLTLLHQRRYEEARAQLESAVRLEIRRWRAHNALGVLSDLRQDYVAAGYSYDTALRIVPDSPLVHNNKGYSAYLAGEHEKAIEHLRRAVAKGPQYQQAWRNLGLVYAKTGEYDRALEAFERVVDKPVAYNNVGFICLHEGNYADAERFLQKAIELAPKYYDTAHENLAKLKQE